MAYDEIFWDEETRAYKRLRDYYRGDTTSVGVRSKTTGTYIRDPETLRKYNYVEVAAPYGYKYTDEQLQSLITATGNEANLSIKEARKSPAAIQQMEKKYTGYYAELNKPDKTPAEKLLVDTGQVYAAMDKETVAAIEKNPEAMAQLEKKQQGYYEAWPEVYQTVTQSLQESSVRVQEKKEQEFATSFMSTLQAASTENKAVPIIIESTPTTTSISLGTPVEIPSQPRVMTTTESLVAPSVSIAPSVQQKPIEISEQLSGLSESLYSKANQPSSGALSPILLAGSVAAGAASATAQMVFHPIESVKSTVSALLNPSETIKQVSLEFSENPAKATGAYLVAPIAIGKLAGLAELKPTVKTVGSYTEVERFSTATTTVDVAKQAAGFEIKSFGKPTETVLVKGISVQETIPFETSTGTKYASTGLGKFTAATELKPTKSIFTISTEAKGFAAASEEGTMTAITLQKSKLSTGLVESSIGKSIIKTETEPTGLFKISEKTELASTTKKNPLISDLKQSEVSFGIGKETYRETITAENPITYSKIEKVSIGTREPELVSKFKSITEATPEDTALVKQFKETIVSERPKIAKYEEPFKLLEEPKSAGRGLVLETIKINETPKPKATLGTISMPKIESFGKMAVQEYAKPVKLLSSTTSARLGGLSALTNVRTQPKSQNILLTKESTFMKTSKPSQTISLLRSSTERKTDIFRKNAFSSLSAKSVDVSQSSKTIPSFSFDTATATKQVSATDTLLGTQTTQVGKMSGAASLGFGFSTKAIKPKFRLGDSSLSSFGKSSMFSKTSQKKAYTPSIYAITFKVKGKGSKGGILSGLGVRGI